MVVLAGLGREHAVAPHEQGHNDSDQPPKTQLQMVGRLLHNIYDAYAPDCDTQAITIPRFHSVGILWREDRPVASSLWQGRAVSLAFSKLLVIEKFLENM